LTHSQHIRPVKTPGARRALLVAVAVVSVTALQASPSPETLDRVDLDAVYRIKQEGLQRSQVMELASYLTDVYGPRLTGSPEIKEAADWAQRTMREWGLQNVHVETFPFGRGWQNRRMTANALTPRAYPLIAYPKAWTPGTKGPVSGDAVIVSIRSDNDFATYKGKLRGRFVLASRPRDLQARFEPLASRYTAAELDDLARQPVRRPQAGGAPPAGGVSRDLARKITQFWIDEGVAAVLEPSRGDGGTLFVQSGGSRNATDPPVAAQVVVAAEQYGRIYRTLEKKVAVTLQMDIDSQFLDADTNAFNVLAELPGTDKADEIVMLGAHFDSWHTSTGATDNAAGSAIMMEAMRILKTSGIRLRRTVRIALWSGEEEGLLGSRAYVKSHFADPATMQPLPEHGKLSGYFNVDNGTGAIRGVYLQGNEAIGPLFASWMEPFHNMGMATLAIRNTGGTDHVSFDAVGLPGFQFIQDEVEYDTRTHHSNMDAYERLQPQDLMQNAVIVAAFVMQTANRDERLPRKPMPPPPPARTGAGR
jgi:hypothetical protein